MGWTASPIATGYNVKRSTTSGGSPTVVGSVAGTRFIDSTAVNGTTYYYVVSALDGGGESANSSQVSVAPQAVVASAPSGLSGIASNGRVKLAWNQAAGAASYNVYRSTTSGGGYVLVGNAAGTNFTDPAASNGVVFYYVVTSLNSIGESSFSSEVSASPQPAAPQQPTNLTATAGINQVTLNWTGGTNAASYNVYRSTTSDSNFTLLGNTSATTCTDTTAIGGTTYYYAVAGVDSAGQSNPSLQVSAVPLPPIPAPPTGLTATGSTSTESGSNPVHVLVADTVSFSNAAGPRFLRLRVTASGF